MTPIHAFGEFVRRIFMAVPLGAARGLFLGLLVGLFVWVLTLPAESTWPDTGSRGPTANLKVWACVALAIQIAIYAWL
ncbi:MAG: hypothetical protein FJ297_18280 [Planctomycetes bacterium]|nr:hypothetical protein [Planctomycetota bacterium]